MSISKNLRAWSVKFGLKGREQNARRAQGMVKMEVPIIVFQTEIIVTNLSQVAHRMQRQHAIGSSISLQMATAAPTHDD